MKHEFPIFLLPVSRHLCVVWWAIAWLSVASGGQSFAAGKGGKAKAEARTRQSATAPAPEKGEDVSSETKGDEGGGESERVNGKKAKVLSFGALDVEGKMRTPQLLFFLNRVKAELDSTTELKRSFMKELNATAKEKGL